LRTLNEVAQLEGILLYLKWKSALYVGIFCLCIQ